MSFESDNYGSVDAISRDDGTILSKPNSAPNAKNRGAMRKAAKNNESNHTTRDVNNILANEDTIREMKQQTAKLEASYNDDRNNNTPLQEKAEILEKRLCQIIFLTLFIVIVSFLIIILLQHLEHEKSKAEGTCTFQM